jgi:hypothetical protein
MTAAPPAPVVAPPSEIEKENINKFAPTPADIQLALAEAEGPFKVGDLLCRHIVFDRCELVVQVERIATALEREPPEVRAAAAEELAPILAKFTEFSPYFVNKVRARLALPDEPIAVSEADRARANEIFARALAECAICVIDVPQFWDKYVDSVVITQDSRGRHVFLLYIKAPEGTFMVKLRRSDICSPVDSKKRGKAAENGDEEGGGKDESSASKPKEFCAIPDELNYLLTLKLGIALYSQKDLEEDAVLVKAKKRGETFAHRQGATLLALLEENAKPDFLMREVTLRQALRELLMKGGTSAVPILYKNSVHGRWCEGGFLFIPTRFFGEVVDAMAVKFGSRRAFISTAEYFGLLRQPSWRHRYVPAAEDNHKCPESNPACGSAYVFNVKALADFLGVSERELCD